MSSDRKFSRALTGIVSLSHQFSKHFAPLLKLQQAIEKKKGVKNGFPNFGVLIQATMTKPLAKKAKILA
jgi:hypothetical protein